MAVMNKASTRPEEYAIDIGITTSETSACSRFGKRSRVFRLSEQIAQSREQEESPKHACGGLLREVVVNSGHSYFDTNVSDHHHFFFEDTGRPLDIPGEYVAVSGLPKPPAGAAIRRIDVIIRVGRDPAPAAD